MKSTWRLVSCQGILCAENCGCAEIIPNKKLYNIRDKTTIIQKAV